MPRPRVEDRGFSSLKLKRKRNMAYCYCFGKPWYFGPWDDENDKPTVAAKVAFLRQVQQWAANPEAAAKEVVDQGRMSRVNGGPLFISLWADWRAAPGAINPKNGIPDTCEKLLFMGGMADGMNHSHTGVSEFTLPMFSDWQERLCAKRRNDGSPWYARATVQKHVSMILKCFQWGVQKGRVKFEQYASLKLLTPSPKSQARAAKTRNVVGEEMVRETLDHLFASAHPLLWCLWYTGARPSELCRLRSCDLRRNGKVTSLSGVELDLDELGVWCTVLTKHKTMDKSKDRVVFFGPLAQSWILKVLEGRKTGGKEPLFPNEDGKHFTPPVLQNKVRRACIRRGVPGWQVYSMRHTRSVKVQQKFSRDAARAVLGHTGGITSGYAGADLMSSARVMMDMG